MTLYKIENNKLNIIKEKKSILEKDVEKIVGENLEDLMGLKFVTFQFNIEKKFLDILAFDEDLNAPVIIELKRENDKGLFDQGMEYFNILSDRKSDFLLKLHEVLKIPADLKKINWSSSRVIFIGKNFTQRQMRAIDFKGIPIELWDYNLYENNFFELKEVGLKKKANLDIDVNVKNSNIVRKVKKEFKEYDLEHHFGKGTEKIISFYKKLESEILNFDNTKIKLAKMYIGFWDAEINKLFCDAKFYKGSLQVTFWSSDKKITNKFNFIRDSKGAHGNGEYIAKIEEEENLDFLIPVLKKSQEQIRKKYEK